MAIFVMLNNYLHDVATALLLCSALIIFWLAKENKKDKIVVNIYKKMRKLAIISFVWIIIGGFIRAIFYKNYEWSDAVGKGQVSILILKHIIIFTFVILGIVFWIKLEKKFK
jgi:membrane protease YdiL (CAAX protease family)